MCEEYVILGVDVCREDNIGFFLGAVLDRQALVKKKTSFISSLIHECQGHEQRTEKARKDENKTPWKEGNKSDA